MHKTGQGNPEPVFSLRLFLAGLNQEGNNLVYFGQMSNHKAWQRLTQLQFGMAVGAKIRIDTRLHDLSNEGVCCPF